jgi:hypothetical protein
VWDTDADVGVAVWEWPKLLKMNLSSVDQSVWSVKTLPTHVFVHGAWDHSESSWLQLVHRATGVRVEMWVSVVLPAAECVSGSVTPLATHCALEWDGFRPDSARPIEMMFPLSNISMNDGEGGVMRIQTPRLDRLQGYLETALPGSTSAPPKLRQQLCLDSRGWSDSWYTQQLLPDWLYRHYWLSRQSEDLAEGRASLQLEAQSMRRWANRERIRRRQALGGDDGTPAVSVTSDLPAPAASPSGSTTDAAIDSDDDEDAGRSVLLDPAVTFTSPSYIPALARFMASRRLFFLQCVGLQIILQRREQGIVDDDDVAVMLARAFLALPEANNSTWLAPLRQEGKIPP